MGFSTAFAFAAGFFAAGFFTATVLIGAIACGWVFFIFMASSSFDFLDCFFCLGLAAFWWNRLAWS
ncbi:hypothetical protein D3C80_2201620 [compost metagenome]